MGLKEIIVGAGKDVIEYVFDMFRKTLGSMIEGLLAFLTEVITKTPYPTETGSVEPLVFGIPQDTLWGSLHTIYADAAQPYAYILWFFALIAVQFTGIFDGWVGGINTEKSKKKLMIAFIGITLWWPAGVMILAFSDALGTLLMNLGTPGDASEGIGLARTYDVVTKNLEVSGNIPGLFITTILWGIEFIILLILAILWFIRIAMIYIGMPLMPIFIALWALEFPGVKPLQTIGQKAMSTFTTLAFITIPGALIVGFFGTIIDIAATQTNSILGTNLKTGKVTNDGNSHADVIVNQPDATADPVGAFSSAIQPDASTTSVALSATPQTANVAEIGGNLVASLVFAIILMCLPILAGLGPFIIVKYTSTGKSALGAAGFLANPAGSLVGAATKAAGAADKGVAVKKGYKYAKEKRRASKGSEATMEAFKSGSEFHDDETGNFVGWSNLGGDYAKRLQTAHSSGGAGAALGIGAAGLIGGYETTKDELGSLKQKASDANPGREALWTAYRGAHMVRNNKKTFAKFAAENASNAASHITTPAAKFAKENLNKAERELFAHNAKNGVKDFAGKNYERIQAAKNGELSIQERRREELRKVDGREEADVARMATFINPHKDSMDEEQTRNVERFGLATSDESLDSMTGDKTHIEVPEVKFTSTNDVTVSDVQAHTGESKEVMAADAVEKDLTNLITEAEQAFDDVDLRYSFDDAGTMELQYNLDDDQLNTALGQQIQEAEAKFDGKSFQEMDLDSIIQESGAFEELQRDVIEEHSKEVTVEMAEQVAEQLGDGLEKHIDREIGHIPDEVESELMTALDRQGIPHPDDFKGDVLDSEALRKISNNQANADLAQEMLRSV